MRIVLQINQGVRKVILRNPNCENLYMYALNVIPVGEQFFIQLSGKGYDLFQFLYYL